jgi:hypothetical protein
MFATLKVLAGRTLFAAVAMALAAGLAFAAPVRAEDAAGVSKPRLTGWMVFVDTDAKIDGVGFQFDVNNADAVEENRKIALALLPDAIAVAEAKKAQWVVLRASQKTDVVRGMQMSKVYGYVWEKDPTSGAWVPKTQ